MKSSWNYHEITVKLSWSHDKVIMKSSGHRQEVVRSYKKSSGSDHAVQKKELRSLVDWKAFQSCLHKKSNGFNRVLFLSCEWSKIRKRHKMGGGLLATTFMNCIRNKTFFFLFVKIETWNFQNLYDVKLSSICLDKQKSFVSKKKARIAQFHCHWIEVKLCNSCNI